MSDRRCGTCKHWRQITGGGETFNLPPLGKCDVPLPDSVNYWDVENMWATNGQSCPCWTPIDAARAEEER